MEIKMTNSEIMQTALRQSALELGCTPEDLLRSENTVVRSRPAPAARRYLSLPFVCNLVCYGAGIVASVSPEVEDTVRKYIDRIDSFRCFETPSLNVLSGALRPLGYGVCFMAEYWLPDAAILHPLGCDFELRMLNPADFDGLYLPEWSNALCEKRRDLDMLACGAYDGKKLVGLAGCSADCESMWQIGIDVLPGYRRRGIASALTSRLAAETAALGKVPFYCCAWSNIASAKNAMRSGFRPAWVELTAKDLSFIDSINGEKT